MSKPSIPKINNERITELLARIRPCVRKKDKLHFIGPLDPRDVAFTWNPTLEGEAPSDLPVLAKIRTLHTYGYYGLFKPSLAEVLAQIPADLVGKVTAFETHGPQTADDFYRDAETKAAFDAGFHTAETTLYGGEPLKVLGQSNTAWDRVGEVL